jgi:hypothetical protein
MTDPTITCPNCGTDIKLTESLAAPLIAATKKEYEAKLSEKNADIAKREKAIGAQAKALEEARNELDQQVADQVATQLQKDRTRITAEEAKKAKRAAENDLEQKNKELADLQGVLKQRNEKLAEAQKAEVDFRKKQRELDDAKRELDLTVEKRIQDGLAAVRTKAVQDAEESLKLKVAEKDQTIASMHKQIEDLKRRAEQGSQQLQGEVQELELETLLRNRFPLDTIDPVPKGEFGGDVLQRVAGPSGQPCGTILWESKRTKNWSDGWLAKLRDDQRAAKADVSVIVSQVLPKDIETFDARDGVWIAHPRCIVPIATVLRDLLVQVSTARQFSVGQQTKTELIYQYLTGPRFRQRVEAIVEAFSSMQEDLDKEKKAILKQWAKREAQIDNVMKATVGMYGDLQGIAGKSLQEIEGLGLMALEDGSFPTAES